MGMGVYVNKWNTVSSEFRTVPGLSNAEQVDADLTKILKKKKLELQQVTHDWKEFEKDLHKLDASLAKLHTEALTAYTQFVEAPNDGGKSMQQIIEILTADIRKKGGSSESVATLAELKDICDRNRTESAQYSSFKED